MRLRYNWIHPVWLQGLALYLLCFAILSAIIFASPGFLGTDDYYHARLSAQIIDQKRLAIEFPWLPMTILSPRQFVDHHLLYHLYIAPWTSLAGINGAKLATVSIAAGVFLASWGLMRQIGVRHPVFWTLALFGLSVPFLYRMLMIRTQGASLLLLILALMFLFKRRYRWLVVLGFAYTWLYNGFVLLLGFVVLYTAAQWIAERRIEWQSVFYCALGIGLGLVINPYFPQNIQFILDHLLAKVDLDSSVRVGNEWYPYTTGALMQNSAGALLALALAFLRSSFSERRRDTIENTLLMVALLTLFMVLRSRRFIEYYPAFALLLCAAAWGRDGFLLPQVRWLVPAGGFTVLALFAGITLTDVYDDARAARDVETFSGASAWLQTNTPPGSMIFQTDWDDFTRLFYYNTQNIYLVGLDPTYLQLADKHLWDEWVAITQGKIENPSTIIRSTFGAEYIVSDRNHSDFEREARKDPNLEQVYGDQYSLIWRVVPARVENVTP
jgi:hypothetical protein